MSKTMWNSAYDREEFVYGREPNDFLKEHYGTIPVGEVLLLADGEGRNSVFLALQGYTVTAVDISEIALEKAKKLAGENGVAIEYICADLAEFDLGEKRWDGIVSIFCHLPPRIRKPFYANVAQSLKRGGVFLLEGYTPEQLRYKTGGPPVAELMLSREILLAELSELDFSLLEEKEREVHEGSKHHGLGAVVQAIGRS